MSSQVTVDLDELRRVVEEANRISQALGFGAEDPGTGLQLMEHWLPEPIKKLLIEEHRRPDSRKTHVALVKYFNPQGTGTWYFSEYDPEYDRFFGLCKIHEAELGYASNKEMRELRAPPFKLPLERDIWFEPKVLSEIMEAEQVTSKKPFTDLEFRGTRWYLAEEVDRKLEAVKDHMKSYPDKTDNKYSIERHHPSPAGSHFFNSVLFLTHLETWHKQLEEILEAKSP